MKQGKPEHLWEEIKNRVPGAASIDQRNIWITYGKEIWSESPIPPEILEHELIHVRQQTVDMDKDVWWNNWLNDLEFRYKVELEGYRRQVEVVESQGKNIDKYKKQIALILCGPIYGNIKSFSDVMVDLK
ncbi:MAG TPA: hypothetical protein VIJ14_01560 [Rhabdochlamydiaceae bacterium]